MSYLCYLPWPLVLSDALYPFYTCSPLTAIVAGIPGSSEYGKEWWAQQNCVHVILNMACMVVHRFVVQ